MTDQQDITRRRKAVIAQQKYQKRLKSLGIQIVSPEDRKKYQSNYNNKYPWAKHHRHAYTRSVYPYGDYFYKKFEFSMQIEDFKELWFRDKAYLLKNPSIDRIDSGAGYTKNNCRFIERSENSRLANLGKILPLETRNKMSISAIKAWKRRKSCQAIERN